MTTGLAVLFFFEGLLMIGLAMPMIRGTVKRNALYGFRTPKTLSSDEIWYPANAYSGKQMLGAGGVIAGLSLVLAVLSPWIKPEIGVFVGLAIVLLPLLVAVYRSFLYLEKL